MGCLGYQLCQNIGGIIINFHSYLIKYQPNWAFTLKAFFYPLKLIGFQLKGTIIEFSILKSRFLSLFCNYFTETYYAKSYPLIRFSILFT